MKTLEDILREHPWDPALLAGEKPIETLWHWDLAVSPRDLWPHVADTSSMNRRMGLPQAHYSEKDGRLVAWSQNGPIRLEWEEVPWEWEYAKTLRNMRVYSKGFGRAIRGHFFLEEKTPGRTDLTVYFGWAPRGLLGRVLIPASMKWLKGRFDAELASVEATVRATGAPPVSPAPPPLDARVVAELASIEDALRAKGLDRGLVERALDLIRSAPDDDVLRIKPRRLARRWGVPLRPLLGVLLHATRAGAFVLSWDVVCPHCRGVRAELGTLGDVPKTGDCPACDLTFDATKLNALEATFRIHRSLRTVAPKMFCAAEPATKPHIVLQRTARAGARLEIASLLEEGRYRLRLKGAKDYGTLEVAATGAPASVSWKAGAVPDASSGPRPTFVLDGAGAKDPVFVVEQAKADDDAVLPADLFSFQDFRDLFSDQAVGADIQLEVGAQTVLFTDLVESTRYYHAVGDAEAFAQVRRHFVSVFEVIRANGGAVVKTIGDAAMGAFERPADALKAAVELQKRFPPPPPGEKALRIRVSLHSGSCLAVNLNSGIDYFGNTVNLAAKLQSEASAGQIVFTDDVRASPGAADALGTLRVEKLTFAKKWADGASIPAYRVTV